MTERRRFNSSERVALYLYADGKCASCGACLEPGWHADHVSPYSRGGPTDVINGQALCPPCNLKKADRPMTELREWQAEALEKFLHTGDDFLCVATPGAGKTCFALAAAERLIHDDEIDQVIVVAPTSHMRAQWAAVAHSVFKIQLDSKFANGVGAVARDFDGVAVTYQSVCSQPLLYRKLAAKQRTLVILDEIHHGGDSEYLSWGPALREAFGDATRRLLLSGTPDRTDRNPVPFVQYDNAGQFKANYSYDYGQALRDKQGVVRPIAFPTYDGDARWRDATSVESKLRLSDADEATRAKALASALLPDGLWIRSVLHAGNEELTRQRELVPDAGGLVVAADQKRASAYAELLESICGEPVTVAVSDQPDASERISNFARSGSRWIVAVQMVSEGVDIPRLVVGVYATNCTTSLFFRQVAGRFVRTRSPEDESCAALFIPSVEPLVGYAAEIERTVPQALAEAEERVEREAKAQQLEINLVVPLAPSEGVHVGTIFSGDSFTDAELRAAIEAARRAGLPASVTPAQAAMFMRQVSGTRTVGTAVVDIPQQPLEEQKRIVRKKLSVEINALARARGESDGGQKRIHADLNRVCRDTVPTATLESLNERVAIVRRWRAEL